MATTEITGMTDAVVASSQRIVLAFHGEGSAPTTDVVVQIGVPATTADYGVLIPVPSDPVLDPFPISIQDLDLLAESTAPVVREETTTYHPIGCTLGCGAADGENATISDDGSTAVHASSPVNIGPVAAVVIAANDAAALSDWLTANGFAIPSDEQPLVERYVAAGERFIAIKRTAPNVDGFPSSVGIHYTLSGDHREVSLAFARLGAAPVVSFTLFVTANLPGVTDLALDAAQPFATIPFSALDAKAVKNDYAAELAAVVEENGFHAFVKESTRSPSRDLSPLMRAILGKGLITRLATAVPSDKLDIDVRIDQEGSPESGEVVIEHIVHGPDTDVGVAGLVFGARALRRRRRTRERAAKLEAGGAR